MRTSNLNRFNTLDRQFLALVSQKVISQKDTVDLGTIGHEAAQVLRLDGAQQHRMSKLLGTWIDPRAEAQAFLGQLQVDLVTKALGGISEPNLLTRIQASETAVKRAVEGTPEDLAAQLPKVLTASAWDNVFVF